MINTHDPLEAVSRALQLLKDELDCACGALMEVSTVWRRVYPSRPDLPFRLLDQLEEDIRQLAVSAEAAVDVGPGQPPDLAFVLAGRLEELKKDISEAESVTCGAGTSSLGDAGLWSYLRAAMHRAGNRLLVLIVQLARIDNWSLSGPAAVFPDPDGACLLVRLG